jgi:hypothetical protein
VINHTLDPRTWAEEHFREAAFLDIRRTDRVVTIAAAMAAQPGVSLPQLFGRWYDTKAAYNLFKPPEATPDTVQAGHRALVLDARQENGCYLLLEDTTELDWSGRQSIPGLPGGCLPPRGPSLPWGSSSWRFAPGRGSRRAPRLSASAR